MGLCEGPLPRIWMENVGINLSIFETRSVAANLELGSADMQLEDLDTEQWFMGDKHLLKLFHSGSHLQVFYSITILHLLRNWQTSKSC